MTPLIQLLIQESPALIGFVQSLSKASNPDDPVPTSEDVIRAFDTLFANTLAKDKMLRIALEAELAKE